MHHLAKIEVFSAERADTLTPSLAILEDNALSENWPGIQGQVLLLKADLAILNSDESQLREIIQQLRKLIDVENLDFLKESYERLLGRI